MALEHRVPRDLRPEQVTIFEILVAYALHGAGELATKLPLKRALRHGADYLEGVTLAQFTKQKWFIKQLAEGLPPVDEEKKKQPAEDCRQLKMRRRYDLSQGRQFSAA